jgi:hypothetical protein
MSLTIFSFKIVQKCIHNYQHHPNHFPAYSPAFPTISNCAYSYALCAFSLFIIQQFFGKTDSKATEFGHRILQW